MAMIVAGYVGCFDLVGKSNAPRGPYVWVGLETFLSLVRTSIWGYNPTWDENPGLKLSLRLADKEVPLPPADEDDNSKSPSHVEPVAYFPIITTTTQIPFVNTLTHTPSFEGATFIAYPESDFLSTATSYTGPLTRFKHDDISSLLYAIVGLGRAEKVLVTVALFAHSRASWCLIFNDAYSWAVSSTYQVLPKTTALLVTLGSVIKKDNVALSREVYDAVSSHCRSIAAQFFGSPQPTLVLKWTLSADDTHVATRINDEKVAGTLTPHDNAYISISMEFWKRKSIFMRSRQESIRQYLNFLPPDEDFVARAMHKLYLYLLETVILEMDLCQRDHQFASARMVSDVSLSRRLALEWIYGMNIRMTEEKRTIDSMCPETGEGMWTERWGELRLGFELLRSGLELLRESGDVAKLNWMLGHIRNLREPLEQVQPPIATFDQALGNRFMNGLWARCSGVWVSSERPADREAYELEFHLTLLRLKALLERGYSVVGTTGPLADPARFFQPYLFLDEFSDYHIKGLQRSNIPCAIQLRPGNDLHAREFLTRLASLPIPIDQLTTIDITRVEPYPELPKTLHDILNKHHKIISIACPHFEDPDEIEQLRSDLSENRKAWYTRAGGSRDFQYIVGFEPDDPFTVDRHNADVTDLLSMKGYHADEPLTPQVTMTADGQDILLHDGRIECVVLLHAPSSGRVIIELNCVAQHTQGVSSWSVKNVEMAGRYKSTEDSEDEWNPISVEPRQPGDESPLQLVSDVAQRGNYEVRIHLSKKYDYDDFLHGSYVRLKGLPLIRFEEKQ